MQTDGHVAVSGEASKPGRLRRAAAGVELLQLLRFEGVGM
jgi:hypothetical protein